MRILIDTREQRPLDFSHCPGVETERATLHVGDYSLPGFENEIVVERKSLSDLVGSITFGRMRFKKELQQLRAFRFAALVVECHWSDIERECYRSRTNANVIMGSLMTFAMKYRVVPIVAGDREIAAQAVFRIFHNFLAMIERDHKKLIHGREAARKV